MGLRVEEKISQQRFDLVPRQAQRLPLAFERKRAEQPHAQRRTLTYDLSARH